MKSIIIRGVKLLATVTIAGGAIFGTGLAASAGDKTTCAESAINGNGNGANQSGAYDSNCTGAAAKNGIGNGKATGKPCAGCVGKADDKNPPGQAPDGSDHNNGYECDGNSGIGKTNPAHTGCTPSTDGYTDYYEGGGGFD